MNKTSHFSRDQLRSGGRTSLFGQGNAQLPSDELLMVDRISHLSTLGGKYGRGQIKAELDIHPGLWFFDCHFKNDPVMPGCLGLDAMWQLIGFYLGWLGLSGRGRALGVGAVKFAGQILPDAKTVSYQIDLKRVISTGASLAIADGTVSVDGKEIYSAEKLKVGLFLSDMSRPKQLK